MPGPDDSAPSGRFDAPGVAPVVVNGNTVPAAAVALAVEASSRTAVIAMDLRAMLVHASPGFCELTGWSRDELVGRTPPFPYWPPEDAEAIGAMVREVLQGEIRKEGYSLRMMRKNGERFDAHSLITPLLDDSGQHIGYVSSTHDVSHDLARRQRLKGIGAALNSASEGVLLADADDRYTFANDAFGAMCGVKPEQMIGQTWRAVVPEVLHARAETAMAGTLHNPAVGTFERELSLPLPDGTPRWLAVHGLALWGPGHEYVGHLGHVRDVTAQHLERDELTKLRTAVEAATEAIYITDPSGLITYANPAFSKIYGHDLEDVIGKVTPRIVKSGTLPAERYVQFWATILAKQPIRGELTNRTKDGRLIDVESSVDPVLGSSGEILGFVSIQRDITERKALMAQLNQAQKMEALGRLAGGVAHDFNNVLSVVLSYADFLGEAVADQPELLADVREIRHAGERAAALTRQLLVFSRKEAARPEIIELNGVIANIEKMLRRTIGEDVSLLWDPTPDLPFIKVDPGHLEQILMNLAVNARDAMRAGGQLTLTTDCLEIAQGGVATVDPIAAGRYCLIEVRDTGCGMPAAVLEHAFDPFFTTKERGKGTGLGLSIVFGMVKQAGGYIGVDSEVGRGTTFRIYLPVTDEIPIELQTMPEVLSRRGQGETVLLVEDEDAVRTLVERILLRAGYRVLDARGSGEALLICERHDECIDVLLTDIVMPQLSGTDLAERIVRMRPNIRVLFMSGYAENLQPHSHPNAAPFLRKPIVRDALLQAMDKALGHRSASGAWIVEPQ